MPAYFPEHLYFDAQVALWLPKARGQAFRQLEVRADMPKPVPFGAETYFQ